MVFPIKIIVSCVQSKNKEFIQVNFVFSTTHESTSLLYMGIIAARDWPMFINFVDYYEHIKVMNRLICELTKIKLPTTNQRHFDNTQPLAPTNYCDSTFNNSTINMI